MKNNFSERLIKLTLTINSINKKFKLAGINTKNTICKTLVLLI